ncbi:hypothetical protein HCC74_07320 [Lentilactobacillus parabuchneri]|nr:hypothetical protein [Lentilactobacillus parabuchneri]APR06531.1 hypothetical protein FAM21731_00310 [Lentilactobacillus parabuchneri]MBW0223828.1 hypothetical protein [Lentilactobacillus parabuchneri]MBW0246211.1 hypothetical protein [Lentilactobacillus parabuchneri]MBW0264406.1 hypothetical protein [Lentilactobacillus parabuchneri]MCT2884991.1 hypothetical protein [Lentilactobacillus parabuchneri]
MTESNDEWKESLKSEKAFHEFIINYFKAHKELTGTYDIPSYYEHYVVRLDNSDGIIISLTTGMNQTSGNAPMTLPTKEKEKMSIEDFRTLILNKKFADQNMSLADVFQTVAGVPSNKDN